MPHIVEAGPMSMSAPGRWWTQAGPSGPEHNGVAGIVTSESRAALRDEEGGCRPLRQEAVAGLGIPHEDLGGRPMHRDDPGLAKFGATDREEIPVQRDIGVIEHQRFTDA